MASIILLAGTEPLERYDRVEVSSSVLSDAAVDALCATAPTTSSALSASLKKVAADDGTPPHVAAWLRAMAAAHPIPQPEPRN